MFECTRINNHKTIFFKLEVFLLLAYDNTTVSVKWRLIMGLLKIWALEYGENVGHKMFLIFPCSICFYILVLIETFT